MMTAESIELAAATADFFGDEALVAARIAQAGAAQSNAPDRTQLWAEVCAVLEKDQEISRAREISG